MRQIVLDTETTGLEPDSGHRIIEIGCVELLNRRPTGRHFHKYIDPDHLTILIVGDRSKIEAPLAATKIAPITVLDVNGDPIRTVVTP